VSGVPDVPDESADQKSVAGVLSFWSLFGSQTGSMSGPCAVPIELSDQERELLESWVLSE
jgi:hypothetical protein